MTAPHLPMVEQVAIALSSWLNSQKRPEPPEAIWATLTEEQRDAYREQAQAGLDACHAEEAFDLLLLMRREYGAHLSVCGKTLIAVDNLLIKLGGKP